MSRNRQRAMHTNTYAHSPGYSECCRLQETRIITIRFTKRRISIVEQQ